jgi:hypothetical protein
MHRILIMGLLMGAALIIPASAEDRRYYDREGKDYHTWNSQEDRAYRSYLLEQKRQYREFHRVRPAQRTEHFRWRHCHPDTMNREVR